MKYLVGLTGPTGAGKSTVSAVFEENGFFVICADVAARKAVEKGSPALLKLSESFGADIICPDGSLNRKLLADRAFSSKENTALLNSITHPYIEKLIDAYVLQTDCEYIVLDAPQLFESGMDKRCDTVVGVLADNDLRQTRIVNRDGITQAQAQIRMNAQLTDDFYRENCEHIIYNNADENELKRQATEIIKVIRECAHE